MTVQYKFDPPFVIMTTSGGTPFLTMIDSLTEMFDSPEFPAAGKLIINLQASTQQRSPGEVRVLADVVGVHHPQLHSRCALIVAKPVHFGLSRMFATMADKYPLNVQVFWNMEDAVEWVNGGESKA